jgi:hypothetical protein
MLSFRAYAIPAVEGSRISNLTFVPLTSRPKCGRAVCVVTINYHQACYFNGSPFLEVLLPGTDGFFMLEDAATSSICNYISYRNFLASVYWEHVCRPIVYDCIANTWLKTGRSSDSSLSPTAPSWMPCSLLYHLKHLCVCSYTKTQAHRSSPPVKLITTYVLPVEQYQLSAFNDEASILHIKRGTTMCFPSRTVPSLGPMMSRNSILHSVAPPNH